VFVKILEGLRAFPWIPDPVKDRSGMTEGEELGENTTE
jgi:hypothetical protein